MPKIFRIDSRRADKLIRCLFLFSFGLEVSLQISHPILVLGKLEMPALQCFHYPQGPTRRGGGGGLLPACNNTKVMMDCAGAAPALSSSSQ